MNVRLQGLAKWLPPLIESSAPAVPSVLCFLIIETCFRNAGQPGQRRYGPTQSKALVCEWEDGAIQVYYRGERMGFTELQESMPKESRPLPPSARAMVVRKAKKDHPWQQSYKNMKPWIPNRRTAGPLVGMRTYASP